MREGEITRYFLKELEAYKVQVQNVSLESELKSKDWVISEWDGSKMYVRLICDGECEPSKEEQELILSTYGCEEISFCRDHLEMRSVLAPIWSEIYVKSGMKAEYESRQKAQREKERREHQAALERKAERQRLAEIRREKQLEKARLYHLTHDK